MSELISFYKELEKVLDPCVQSSRRETYSVYIPVVDNDITKLINKVDHMSKYLDINSLSPEELEHKLRYPSPEYFTDMPYADWLKCISINPMIMGYSDDEKHFTPEVIAIAASLNPFSLKFIPDTYKISYIDYMEMYRIGKMGIFYKLDNFDFDNIDYLHAIEDARHLETKQAYDAYNLKNGMTYSNDGWCVFRDLYNEKRAILEKVQGISDYYTHTLCKNIKDKNDRSTEAYSYHKDPERLSTILTDIAKDIITEHMEIKNDY